MAEEAVATQSTDDRDYYIRRASEERRRAGVCEDNAVALAHLKMADEYERRASGQAPESFVQK